MRETQELVKGVGEITEKAFQIYTHSEREKIEQAKLELGKAQSQNASKEEIGKLAADLDRLQRDYDKAYGTGSQTKRAVDAVTAALQGLAAKDMGQAVIGLASPYLNEQIKKHTAGNTEANLIAHALLGAVEAVATGNNALAGAAAGAGSEATAMVVAKQLYNKKPSELTEAEKQNVVLLSQLAGGLAAGMVGDSSQSTALGAEIGKRAVENNSFGQSFTQYQKDEELRRKDPEAYAKEMAERQELMKNGLMLMGGVVAVTLLPEILTTSSLVAGGFGGGSELIGQLSENNWDLSKLNTSKVLVQTGIGIATKNVGVVGTSSINSGIEFFSAIDEGKTKEKAAKKAGASFVTSFSGGLIGKSVEVPLDRKLNPNWKNYVEKQGHLPYGISEPFKPSYIPSVIGNTLDNTSSKFLEKYLTPNGVNQNEK